ncbi:ferredoxin [Kitasatospora sp. NPDC093806]|uniref:ferredoxin n=1 Tax=Kitasatospora sp. NPDC093806 TaxID=3155075 RepID=UPI0034316288
MTNVPTGASPDTGGLVIVRVDPDRCIGSGMCAMTAPDSLTLGPDGRARPLRGPGADGGTGGDADGGGSDGGEPLTSELTDAVDFCPMEALTLYAVQDGRPISPRG